ncbi:MAG TPA: PorT family protein [Candidatus Alistipes merdigallinarum]|nr:PorT family protein [Candidatus Alistipes merdigallinarum]
MKKSLLLIVFLAAVSIASAQKTFTFGPKVGFNISDIGMKMEDDGSESSSDNDISGAKPTLVIGAFAEFRPVKVFGLSVDVLYSRQGMKNDISTSIGSVNMSATNNIRLHYLNVPVMANIYIIGGLAFKAGIQPGFLLGAKSINDISNDSGSQSTTTDLKKADVLKNVDVTIPVGLAYSFNFGLVLDARYNIPFNDIATNKFNEISEFGSTKVTNRVFTFTAGWRF